MKIKGLENKIRQTLNSLTTNIKNKEKVIAILEQDNQLNLAKLNKLEKEMTYKDDRLFRLDQIIQASALIFQNRLQIINDLKVQLQKEKNKVGASKEFSDHLHEDIKNLEEEKEELDNRIKELEEAQKNNSELRDKELEKLREKENKYKKLYSRMEDILLGFDFPYRTMTEEEELEAESFEIIGEDVIHLIINTKTIFNELKKWTDQFQTPEQVQTTIDNLTQERDSRPSQEEFDKLKEELEIEKGWWDRWINEDREMDGVSSGYIDLGDGLRYRQSKYLSSDHVAFWEIYKIASNVYHRTVIKTKGDRFIFELAQHKRVVKRLYEYYRRQLRAIS